MPRERGPAKWVRVRYVDDRPDEIIPYDPMFLLRVKDVWSMDKITIEDKDGNDVGGV